MHYIASLEKGEIEKIINKKETPNFHNTIKPLAKNTYLKDLLGLAYFSNKIYSDPLTFAIYDDINSLSDKISLELFNNEKMKEKIKYIWGNEDRSKLTYEEIIILENYYYNIYKENEREEILNINRELSKIHNDFIDNLYTQMGGLK
jgi:Zn-dependent oligopeptidase